MAPKTTKTTKTARSTKSTKAVKTSKTAAAPIEPRQAKPVFRTGTWVAVIAFIAIIAAVVYMNRQAEAEITADIEATPADVEEFLFTQDNVVNSIEVKPFEGDTVTVERNESQAWVLTQPDEVEADQGLSEAAASQILALRIVNEIEGSQDPSIFGIDEPDYVITIGFEGGDTSILEIGDMTPSENGYYVRVDGEKIYVVALSGIGALTNLATTPPYLNTPTPVPTATSTPLPTETPVPTLEATPTP